MILFIYGVTLYGILTNKKLNLKTLKICEVFFCFPKMEEHFRQFKDLFFLILITGNNKREGGRFNKKKLSLKSQKLSSRIGVREGYS